MSAAPIIPGRLYHVSGHGLDLNIVAPHPCAALIVALDLIWAD